MMVNDYIRQKLAEQNISKKELALKAGIQPQALNSFINAGRSVPVPVSIRIDAALGIVPGTIARMQTENRIQEAIKSQNQNAREIIIKQIKANGGLWSYDGIPSNLDDDKIIEEGLRHLDLEDLDELFSIWDRKHVKRIWKERILSEGKRSNVLNFLLAVFAFHIKNPEQYVKNGYQRT